MKNHSRTPWFILALVLLLALGAGYYVYLNRQPSPQHRIPIQTGAPEQPTSHPSSPLPDEAMPQNQTAGRPSEPAQLEETEERLEEVDPCDAMFSRMQDYFEYLSRTEYFQRLSPNKRAYPRFADALNRLAEHPPVPAGESSQPRLMLSNLYHFFRTLKSTDLRLAQAVLANETDSLEDTFDMLYTWLLLEPSCADPDGIRPAFDVTYAYAAFFLNTVGGRAYLFRRSPTVRMVVQYYAVMIIYEADKRKKNTYGIDLLPFLAPLRNEIIHFEDLIFQQQYLTNLDRIEYEYRRLR